MDQACTSLVKAGFYEHGSCSSSSPYASTDIVFLVFDEKELSVHEAALRPMKNLPTRTQRKGSRAAGPNDAIVFPLFRHQVGHALVDYLYRGTYDITRPEDIARAEEIAFTNTNFWGTVLRVSLELYALAKIHELKNLSDIAARKATESSKHLEAGVALRIIEACTPLPSAEDLWFRGTVKDTLIAAYGDLKSLVRTIVSGSSYSQTSKRMFTALHLFMDIMVELEDGEDPASGTNDIEHFQAPIMEKDSPYGQEWSAENILFLDRYKIWSSEELRLQDYAQNRRYVGDKSDSSPAKTFDVTTKPAFSSVAANGFGSCRPNPDFGLLLRGVKTEPENDAVEPIGEPQKCEAMP